MDKIDYKNRIKYNFESLEKQEEVKRSKLDSCSWRMCSFKNHGS